MLVTLCPAIARTLAPIVAAFSLAACGPDPVPVARQGTDSVAAGSALDDAFATVPQPVVVESRGDAPARVIVHGVNLTGVGYDLGDPTAPIVMVEFSDFGCPYCAQHALQAFPSLRSEFIETGKVFYKYVPFVIGMFPNGERAVRAAECAGEQGRFWAMHDSVYANQNAWKRGSEPDRVLGALARQTVPDAARWQSCYAADRRADRTRLANAGAARLGVRATPTFFVNGQLVEGALPLAVLRGGLNSLLRDRGIQ